MQAARTQDPPFLVGSPSERGLELLGSLRHGRRFLVGLQEVHLWLATGAPQEQELQPGDVGIGLVETRWLLAFRETLVPVERGLSRKLYLVARESHEEFDLGVISQHETLGQPTRPVELMESFGLTRRPGEGESDGLERGRLPAPVVPDEHRPVGDLSGQRIAEVNRERFMAEPLEVPDTDRLDLHLELRSRRRLPNRVVMRGVRYGLAPMQVKPG